MPYPRTARRRLSAPVIVEEWPAVSALGRRTSVSRRSFLARCTLVSRYDNLGGVPGRAAHSARGFEPHSYPGGHPRIPAGCPCRRQADRHHRPLNAIPYGGTSRRGHPVARFRAVRSSGSVPVEERAPTGTAIGQPHRWRRAPGRSDLPHVTDSLFRLVKEYLGRTVRQALRTITVGTTIAPVIGLARARPSAKSSEEST
jgi:hypothetical protein